MRAGVLALALLFALPAAAQDEPSEDAGAVFLEAARAYGDGDYETAARLFARAYELNPETSLLLNRGLACERAGMVQDAIDAYEQYLEEAPEAEERPNVERSLETLRRQRALEEEIARREAEEEREPEVVAAPEPAPSPSRSGPPSGPAPWVVMGIGAGGLIAGAIVGGLATARYDDAVSAPTQVDALRLEGEANDLGLVANVLLGVGAGVALVGLTWGIIELLTSGGDDEGVSLWIGDARWRLF